MISINFFLSLAELLLSQSLQDPRNNSTHVSFQQAGPLPLTKQKWPCFSHLFLCHKTTLNLGDSKQQKCIISHNSVGWWDGFSVLCGIIWNPEMAERYRMVSLVWLSWTGYQLGAQGSSLCGLSTWLLGLPQKMAIRLPKSAIQLPQKMAVRLPKSAIQEAKS